MEDMQRSLREQVDDMGRRLRAQIDGIKTGSGGGSATPKYSFARLAPVRLISRVVAGRRNPTRVEMLFDHLQEEIADVTGGLGANEAPVVVFVTGSGEQIQVGNVAYRNPDLLVLDGLDAQNQRTRVLTQAGAAQLIVKIVAVEPGAAAPSTDFQFRGNKGQD